MKKQEFEKKFKEYIEEYQLKEYLLNLNEISEIVTIVDEEQKTQNSKEINEEETNKRINEEIDKNLDDKILQMYEYMEYLLEKNNHINVTAIKEESEFLKKHIIDSLYITKYLNKLEEKVTSRKIKFLDIGTGGGFPLIPIKIFKKYDSYGMDRILKKLKVIKEKEDVSIIHSRAEVVAHDEYYRETFDLVTTRAVSSLENVVAYMAGFIKVNGYGIIMRGKKEILSNEDKMELNELLKKYSLRLQKIDNYKLFGEERTNYILKKVTNLHHKLPIVDSKYYKSEK